MKAHVMSGQIKGDQKSKLEHAWLSKDEIREKVDPEYFAAVKDMM